jgi:RTX calcium-binding nonapeptide repeat (4 copies)
MPTRSHNSSTSLRRSGPLAGAVAVLAALVLATGAAAESRVLDLVSTGPDGGNLDMGVSFLDASADGSRVIFETDESLVSADSDGSSDIYERAGGRTTLLSTGPAGGNGNFYVWFETASADGTRVFFQTDEALVSADTDSRRDVYERVDGQTTLISTGPDGGNGNFSADFADAVNDGTRVFFETGEALVSADSDLAWDVYERVDGQTTLVSTGPDGGNGDLDAWFEGASADGTHVLLGTPESLVSADTDTRDDIYERASGQTALVSTGPDGGNGNFDAYVDRASADGTRVIFETDEPLVSADTDARWDVYERADGQTALVSTGPDGGNGNFNVTFETASADGTRVFFETDEALVSADTDSRWDVYERVDGQTTLVSTGPDGGNGNFSADFADATNDGTRVFFETEEALVGSDTDTRDDVYERAGGQTLLVSTGPDGGNGKFDAWFEGVSADGKRVYFETREVLVTGDIYASQDVYERAGGQTTLISTGPSVANGAHPADFEGASDDGSHVFMGTVESLASGDADGEYDLYDARTAHAPVSLPAPTGSGGAAAPAPASSGPAAPLPGACANAKSGSAGIDRLTGGAFGDRLLGLAGNDVLIGAAGDDCLSGGRGNDQLKGNAGNDRLNGGPGKDAVDAGAGNDTINARDRRRESVRCGKGTNDRVRADRNDKLIGCERVTRVG